MNRMQPDFQTLHAPGPWQLIEPVDGSISITSHTGRVIAEVYDNNKYNAALIAASPALYEALVGFLDLVYNSSGIVSVEGHDGPVSWDVLGDLVDKALWALDLAAPTSEEHYGTTREGYYGKAPIRSSSEDTKILRTSLVYALTKLNRYKEHKDFVEETSKMLESV